MSDELSEEEVKGLLNIQGWHWQLSCEQIELIESLGEKGTLIKEALAHHYAVGLEHGGNLADWYFEKSITTLQRYRKRLPKDLWECIGDEKREMLHRPFRMRKT